MNLYRVFFSDSFSGWHTSRWIVAAANKEQAIDLIWRYSNFTCLITDFDVYKNRHRFISGANDYRLGGLSND